MSAQQNTPPARRRLPISEFQVVSQAKSDPAAELDAGSQVLPLTFAEEIRRNIRDNIDNPKLSADSVAKLHGIDRRTLSRRLGTEGTCFSKLHSTLRFESARSMLRDSAAPISAITAALGYSEQSAFSRAFQIWSGISPKRFRSMAAIRT